MAVGVLLVKLGMLHDHAVPGRMVGHHVDNDPEPAPMCLGHEALEVVGRAIGRVDGVVVPHRIRAAQGALPKFLAQRVNRHKPEDVHPEVLEFIETCGNAVKIARCREVARVKFIYDAVTQPSGRGTGRCPGALLCAQGRRQERQSQRDPRQYKLKRDGDFIGVSVAGLRPGKPPRVNPERAFTVAVWRCACVCQPRWASQGLPGQRMIRPA